MRSEVISFLFLDWESISVTWSISICIRFMYYINKWYICRWYSHELTLRNGKTTSFYKANNMPWSSFSQHKTTKQFYFLVYWHYSETWLHWVHTNIFRLSCMKVIIGLKNLKGVFSNMLINGLPQCKNLWSLSLFCSYCWG